MTYIEPVLLDIEISGDELNLTEPGNVQINGWSTPQNWTFNKLMADNFNVLDKGSFINKVQEALVELYSNVSEIDPDISERIVSNVINYLERPYGPLNTGTVLVGSGVVILTSSSGKMFILGESKDQIDGIISSLTSNIEEISDIASDFGLSIELIRGERLAERISESHEADLIDRKQFDNDFEMDIYNEIKSNLTSCIDDNIVLRFGENNPETFEYDILMHVTENSRIVIEVKDATHEEADLGKPQLIDKPRDKSDIMDTQKSSETPYKGQITDCFVIVRGMDSQKLNQHTRKANRRNIHIIEYDEKGNYLEEIENTYRSLVGAASSI